MEFQHILASEYMDRYEGITSELNVNMEYDDAVDVTTTYLGQESIRITDTFYQSRLFQYTPIAHTEGRFVGGGVIDILLDTGASRVICQRQFT